MATVELAYLQILLVKGGSFRRFFDFADENGGQYAVAGTSPRILVKYGSASILEWTLAGGYFTLISPTPVNRIRFDLTTAQINVLTFREASYYFFLNGEDDLLFTGTIQVR